MTEDQIDIGNGASLSDLVSTYTIGGRTLGQWNAYVEAGRTIQERRERLREVPEEWRDAVAAHVAMVWQLKQAAAAKQKALRGE